MTGPHDGEAACGGSRGDEAVKPYRVHDRCVWERIFANVPEDWFKAPPSHAMELCLGFAERESPARLLDLGCGIGRWTVYLARRIAGLLAGVDYSFLGVRAAHRWAQLEGLGKSVFAAGDALSLPFPAAAFDAVVAALLLDNLDREDAARVKQQVDRTVSPGGKGFFVFNPMLQPDELALQNESENPTKDCMHVAFSDDEIEKLLSGWRIDKTAVSREGFRVFEATRTGS